MKTELTLEQSRALVRRGIDADIASKCTFNANDKERLPEPLEYKYARCPNMDEIEPIFTLEDLLGLLPRELCYDSMGRPYTLHMEIEKNRGKAWYARDIDIKVGSAKFKYKELIDALHELLLWCIDNGYVKYENK